MPQKTGSDISSNEMIRTMNRAYLAYGLLTITLTFLLIHFFYGWLHGTVDSWYIDAFAQYVLTGNYPMTSPMLYVHPKILTIEPPMYSVLLAGLFHFPRSDIPLHFLHLSMIVLTMRLLYLILRKIVHPHWAIILSCLYALLPANIIFASMLMTDLTSQFLFMFYIYNVFKFIQTRKIQFLSIAVFLGFFTGLVRYSFMIYGPLTLVWFLAHRPKIIYHYIFPISGVVLLVVWIFLNHEMTGVWGINDSSGVRLHATAVYAAKLLPPVDNPSLQFLRKYLPHDEDLNQPYWEYMDYLPYEYKTDWIRANILFGDIARSAVKAHPLQFMGHVFYSFWRSHAYILPYDEDVGKFGDIKPGERGPACFNYHTALMCTPIVQTTYNYPVWNSYIGVSNFFYRHIIVYWSVYLFFPALLWALFSKHRLLRIYGRMFIVGKLPIGAFGFIDPRYLIPFYPLMVLITVWSVKDWIITVKNKLGFLKLK